MVLVLIFLLIFALFIVWVWMCIACAVVAVSKHRHPIAWSMLGLFLGPLAFLVLARLPQGNKPWQNLPPPLEDPSTQQRPCSSCGHKNFTQNHYCNKCGASLARRRVEPPKIGRGKEEESEESGERTEGQREES